MKVIKQGLEGLVLKDTKVRSIYSCTVVHVHIHVTVLVHNTVHMYIYMAQYMYITLYVCTFTWHSTCTCTNDLTRKSTKCIVLSSKRFGHTYQKSNGD